MEALESDLTRALSTSAEAEKGLLEHKEKVEVLVKALGEAKDKISSKDEELLSLENEIAEREASHRSQTHELKASIHKLELSQETMLKEQDHKLEMMTREHVQAQAKIAAEYQIALEAKERELISVESSLGSEKDEISSSNA